MSLLAKKALNNFISPCTLEEMLLVLVHTQKCTRELGLRPSQGIPRALQWLFQALNGLSPHPWQQDPLAGSFRGLHAPLRVTFPDLNISDIAASKHSLPMQALHTPQEPYASSADEEEHDHCKRPDQLLL